jgi:energy-coupling factor transport system ATP-binding protein
MSVVLQDPSSQLVQPTVAEELVFTARNLDRPEAALARAAQHWTARFGLGDVLGRDPHTLSAGRQQLVALAAALIAEPELLLADEPGAHLDRDARARVLAAVRAERERGLAVVWATQDRDELAAADRVLEVGERREAAGGAASSNGISPAPPALRVAIRPPRPGEERRVSVDAARELAIAARGVTALVGANGVGKTVVLEAVAGVRPSAQVEVRWDRPPDAPALMAGQFPDLQIFEETVGDEVAYAATSRGMPRAEAIDRAVGCFDALGYPGTTFIGRRTWSLSGGEKRVVEIVGSLIAPASLVLLDEPTAGLDPSRKRALAEAVRERSSSAPVMVASQDTEWLSSLSAATFPLGAEPA